MRIAALFLFLLCWLPAWAQPDVKVSEPNEESTTGKDSVREHYIEGFSDYFFVYPIVKQHGLSYELKQRGGSGVLTYRPNNSYNLGLGLYVFELGVEFGFAIPLQSKSIKRYGESDARDLHLNVFAKRWGLNAVYQKYSGFYLVDKENKPGAGMPFPQRPDLGTRNFGVTWHYVFNHQKFSLRSAYNFSERQLTSQGSFLLFASLHTFRVAGDSSIIPRARKGDFDASVDFTRLRHTSFSIAPGYTITLISNHFFLNTTLGVGPAHNWINYDLAGGAETSYDVAINTFVSARLAIGYNGDRLFGGISFMSERSTLRFDQASFSNRNSVFKATIGYRFREAGILKKRVWDLLPFEI